MKHSFEVENKLMQDIDREMKRLEEDSVIDPSSETSNDDILGTEQTNEDFEVMDGDAAKSSPSGICSTDVLGKCKPDEGFMTKDSHYMPSKSKIQKRFESIDDQTENEQQEMVDPVAVVEYLAEQFCDCDNPEIKQTIATLLEQLEAKDLQESGTMLFEKKKRKRKSRRRRYGPFAWFWPLRPLRPIPPPPPPPGPGPTPPPPGPGPQPGPEPGPSPSAAISDLGGGAGMGGGAPGAGPVAEAEDTETENNEQPAEQPDDSTTEDDVEQTIYDQLASEVAGAFDKANEIDDKVISKFIIDSYGTKFMSEKDIVSNNKYKLVVPEMVIADMMNSEQIYIKFKYDNKTFFLKCDYDESKNRFIDGKNPSKALLTPNQMNEEDIIKNDSENIPVIWKAN